MSSNGSAKLDVYLAFGFGLGLYYFYKGFRTYREYRLLMDTPEIPIRSVAMGLVDIHGKAVGADPIPSPVSLTPCYFYKVDIERWVQSRNGGNWSHVATDADGQRFYLQDASGKVLVDAHKAEYDLLRTARMETGSSFGSGVARLFSAASPSATGDLMSYATQAVARQKGSSLWGGGLSGGNHRYRLTEYLVLPDHWYDVTGTCVENPEPRDENDRNMIVQGINEPTFLITWRSEKDIRQTLRNRTAKYVFGGGLLSVASLALLLAKYHAF